MIRIEKPTNPPNVLLSRGVKRTRKDEAAYDNDPDGYISGKNPFRFNKNIYSHDGVKQVLLSAQHRKCCYCEGKIGAGEVEHYRPKGAVKQSVASNKEYPGYYWLAYDWNNLLLSCRDCNQNKGILFPLENDVTRARSHHDNMEDEKPIFINPGRDDPREHIKFYRDEPEPVTELGRETVEGLKLRRNALQECRRSLLNNLIHLHKVVVIGKNYDDPDMQNLVQEAKELLELASSPQSQFSSMALDFLNSTSSIQGRTPNW